MLYFDTSAVLPYYRAERASDDVQTLLRQQSSPVLISDLTSVEFPSALARWVRMGELTEPQAYRIENAFREDIAADRFLVKRIARAHFDRAWNWLLSRKTALRTLDALHLACADSHEATLVTLDTGLRQAAEFFGLRVYSRPDSFVQT